MVFTNIILAPAIAREQSHVITNKHDRQQSMRRQLDFLVAPIKSDAELRSYLASPQFHSSPLKHLSGWGRERFINSLAFNENGLTSFRYEDLRAELTVTQIYHVLSLFGAQSLTPLIRGAKSTTAMDFSIMGIGDTGPGMYRDYPDYACKAKATCTRSYGDICMSSC